MTRRTFRVALLAVFALLLATTAVAVASTRSSTKANHHRPPVSSCAAFRINGHVANPLKLHVDDLRAYPAHDVTVTFQAAGATVTHEYVGALLTDVLATAQPTFDPAIKNDSLDYWGCSAGPTLLVPGDIKGGRYVSTIVKVHVGRAGYGVN
jgi:hypothetical protein